LTRLTVAPRSTQLNATNSPLLHLPGELRNQIYGYVLGDLKLKFYLYKASFRKKGNKLELLFTCRQVYAETALLPYTLNTFTFKTSALKYKPHLRHFLKKSLGAQIQAMSRVRIEMMHGLHVIEKTGLQMVQHLEMVR
jgi:hypothetical protein